MWIGSMSRLSTKNKPQLRVRFASVWWVSVQHIVARRGGMLRGRSFLFGRPALITPSPVPACQFRIRWIDDNNTTVLTTVEYKPPHKLSVGNMLRPMDFWETVVKPDSTPVGGSEAKTQFRAVSGCSAGSGISCDDSGRPCNLLPNKRTSAGSPPYPVRWSDYTLLLPLWAQYGCECRGRPEFPSTYHRHCEGVLPLLYEL